MPEITVYLVQYLLKLFLSSKKQNYLVKDSQLQYDTTLKKNSPRYEGKTSALISEFH